MRKLYAGVTCVLLLLVVVAVPISGTVFSKMYTLQELCDKSSNIVIIETESAESFWSDQEHQHVQTRFSFKVLESLKGNLKSQDTFTMIVYGGSIDDIRVFALGLPQFKMGEKSLIFLEDKVSEKTGEHYFSVVGASQGNFPVIDDDLVVRDTIQTQLKIHENGESLNLTSSNTVRLADIKSHVNGFFK